MLTWLKNNYTQNQGNRKKRIWIAAMLAAIALTSAGCGGGSTAGSTTGGNAADTGSKAEAQQANTDPVKLVLYQRNANISDEEFKILIAEPVKKKYPYIDIEIVHADKEKTPENLVASGNVPDLVFTNGPGVRAFAELDAAQDLSELIKVNRFDLSRFEPNVIDTIKALNDQGKFLAVPFSINFTALFYNKDIFDKFGVPYPKDGLTWEEVTELAKQLTRKDNGQQYYGLNQAGIALKASQLSLKSYDPGTKKAVLATDGWVRAFSAQQAIAGIPGNTPADNIKTFQVDQTLAMSAAKGARIGELEDLYNQGKTLNWDMVSFPTFKEAPKTDAEAATHMLMVTSTSKHKDAAFKVLQVVTEDANQAEMNKRGRLTALKDPKIKENFGASLNSLKGKNIQAVFYNTPAANRYSDKFSEIASAQAVAAMGKVVSGETDINTALRQAEDEANKLIEAELKK